MGNSCLGCPVSGCEGFDYFRTFIADEDFGDDFLDENAKAKSKCIGIEIKVPG